MWRAEVVSMTPTEHLDLGRRALEPVMAGAGFAWRPKGAGLGSGGAFAAGGYHRGGRALTFSFRFSLGVVVYHHGPLTLTHDDYIRVVAPGGRGAYPGFSEDPQRGFTALAQDLRRYCGVFLGGSNEELSALFTAASVPRKRGLP